MDRLSFDIFEPEKKKFHLTPNWIVYGLWAITILFLWVFDGVLPINSESRDIFLVCVVLINLYFLVTSFFKYEPLRGAINGKIIFEKDCILVNGKVFELKDMSNLDFAFINFYGQRDSSYRGNFNPLLSQGVNNYISFTDDKNQPQKFYFRMMTKNSSITLHPFINEAVKLKAMTYYRAIDLIDVENVTKP